MNKKWYEQTPMLEMRKKSTMLGKIRSSLTDEELRDLWCHTQIYPPAPVEYLRRIADFAANREREDFMKMRADIQERIDLELVSLLRTGKLTHE